MGVNPILFSNFKLIFNEKNNQVIIDFEYTFDKQNNWVKQVKSINGEKLFVLKRKRNEKIEGKKILVVGISYKSNIADVRESPTLRLITDLRDKGNEVFWHDPLIESFEGKTSSKVSGEYDLALVLVKHQSLDLSAWRGGPIYCVNPIDSHRDWIPILGSSGK